MSGPEPGAAMDRRRASRPMGGRDAEPSRRVRLDFRHHDELELAGEPVRTNLSAVAAAGSMLWTANDEFPAVEQLVAIDGGRAAYGDHRALALGELFDLPGGPDGEMDIEGLAVDGGYLWVVGSHSLTRGKPKPDESEPAEALGRLGTLKWQPNRAFLGRIPIVPGEEPGRFEIGGRADAGGRQPACLKMSRKRDKGALTRRLRGDEHLGRFLDIPAKENGLDIEGIVARGDRVLVGLRGPVLRSWAVILELEVEETRPGRLRARRMGADGGRYRKHFLHLDGLGVRDLACHGDDLLILAGPSMDLSGPAAVFRWAGGAGAPAAQGGLGTVVPRRELERVLELPEGEGEDHPEGLTVVPHEDGGAADLLVVYDSPAGHRLHANGTSIDADLFELPPRRR